MKIQLKRSNVLQGGSAKEPSGGQMEYGELAVNYNETDPAIFIKDSNNNIIRIAGADNIADDGTTNVPSGGTPPTDPAPEAGNLWFNDVEGRLYIYYVDADSSQWVDASPDSWDNSIVPDPGIPGIQPDTLDERYVMKSGDNMTGNLTLGTDEITLNVDGSATFAGNVGIGADSSNSETLVVESSGSTPSIRINAANSYEAHLKLQANGTANSTQLLAATTNGALAFSRWTGASYQENLRIGSSGHVQIGGSLPASPNTILYADGSAEFDGNVKVGGNTNYVNVKADGGITALDQANNQHVWINNSSPGAIIINDVNSSTNANIVLNANGSATFKAPANGVEVQATGGNDGSKYPFVGKNTSGTTTFSVNGDGAATFEDDVQVGGNANNGTNSAVRLFASGAVKASNTGSNVLWMGYTTGNSTETSTIRADGSAEFSAKVEIQDVTIEGAFGYSIVKTDSAGFWSPDNWYLGPDVSNPSSAVITLNATAGTATFAGTVDVNSAALTKTGIRATDYGTVQIRNDGENSTRSLEFYNGGNGLGDIKAQISNDGSATFGSTITANGTVGYAGGEVRVYGDYGSSNTGTGGLHLSYDNAAKASLITAGSNDATTPDLYFAFPNGGQNPKDHADIKFSKGGSADFDGAITAAGYRIDTLNTLP